MNAARSGNHATAGRTSSLAPFQRGRRTFLGGALVLLAAATSLAGCRESPTDGRGSSFFHHVIVSGVVRTTSGAPVAGATLYSEHRVAGCDSTCTERFEPFTSDVRGEFKQTSVFRHSQTASSMLSLVVTPPAGSGLAPRKVPFQARLESQEPYNSVHLVVVLDPR